MTNQVIKNKIKNTSPKKVLRTLVFAIGIMTLFSFMRPVSVSAGGKPDDQGNIIGSLCYYRPTNRVQLLTVDSSRTACTNEGGSIVEPGQPVPVPICVYGSRIQQMEPTSQGCEAVGGTLVSAGQALPVIRVPDPLAAAGGSGSSGSDTSTGTLKADNDSITRGVCGEGDNEVKTAIDIGCKGLGNPILDAMFAIIRFLTLGAGLVMIGSMIVAGIQYSASKGDPQATAAALKRIANTFGALLLFIFIYAIANWLVPAGLLQ